MPNEIPSLVLADASAWARYLAREADTSRGVWLAVAKKAAVQPPCLSYPHALDEALCYGWIDGQVRKRDDVSFWHRFTPRTVTSQWSKRNTGHITRLQDEGRLKPRGLQEVEKAKADGRWDVAYSQAGLEPPADLTAAIAGNSDAQAMWDTLTKQNKFALCFRLSSLKTQAGREKSIRRVVDMLARGDTPHPQKRTRDSEESRTRVSKVSKPRTKAPQAETVNLPVRRSGRRAKSGTTS